MVQFDQGRCGAPVGFGCPLEGSVLIPKAQCSDPAGVVDRLQEIQVVQCAWSDCGTFFARALALLGVVAQDDLAPPAIGSVSAMAP